MITAAPYLFGKLTMLVRYFVLSQVHVSVMLDTFRVNEIWCAGIFSNGGLRSVLAPSMLEDGQELAEYQGVGYTGLSFPAAGTAW